MSEMSAGSYAVRGRDFHRAGSVSIKIKKRLNSIDGLPRSVIRRVAVVVFEAEVNIISYAEEGEISYRIEDDAIHIKAKDRGQGIPDIEMALTEGFSTADDEVRSMGFGAGMGLPNMRKFSDIFAISSVVDKGTTIKSKIMIREDSDEA